MRFVIKNALLVILVLLSGIINAMTIETVFGKEEVTEPVIVELINSRAMQRLKDIDQSGTPRYFTTRVPAFSRYEHSLGVYSLLKQHNASVAEQIAGLLHDASHTIFSHVGDVVFAVDDKKGMAYQDQIHGWYLEQQEVNKILAKYGLTIADVLPKQANFAKLEQDLPDMCADRIEYNITTGVKFGKITQSDVKQIQSNLHFKDGKWYFSDLAAAKKFAKLSLFFTEHLWASPWNLVMYKFSGDIIQRAVDLKIIDRDDVHFNIDKEILARIHRSKDPKISELIRKCHAIDKSFALADKSKNFDLEFKPKFRGINPLVMINGKLQRLTEVDQEFKNAYFATKTLIDEGVKVALLN